MSAPVTAYQTANGMSATSPPITSSPQQHHDSADDRPPPAGETALVDPVVGQRELPWLHGCRRRLRAGLAHPRAASSRASDRSRPSSSSDSNSGGLTRLPVTATRTGPKASAA